MDHSAINDIEIPDSQWQQFCEGFTRQHHGWLVSMRQLHTRELEAGGAPARPVMSLFAETRPLEEVHEGRNGDTVDIMVMVGDDAGETSFLIENAIALYSRQSGDVHQGLRVDSGDGTTTLIEFGAPAEPETLDGLAESEIGDTD